MQETSEILITVLMPVYNGEKYLKSAIDSILNQTFSEFEFLIINDGSSDNSSQIISSYNDKRIVYINNKKNKGIVNTLNEGLKLSNGNFIARMDADDIAHPNRLLTQLNYMLSHKKCNLCGSQAIAIDEFGNKQSKLRRPSNDKQVKILQLFRNCFIHPSVMIKKHTALEFGYAEDYQYAEDYLLFSQITSKYEVYNLKNQLLYYRVHPENITSTKKGEMENSEQKVIKYMLYQLFETHLTESRINLHHKIIRKDFKEVNKNDFETHLIEIQKANEIKKLYDFTMLADALQKEWFSFLYISKVDRAFLGFVSSSLFSLKRINFKQLFKLLIN